MRKSAEPMAQKCAMSAKRGGSGNRLSSSTPLKHAGQQSEAVATGSCGHLRLEYLPLLLSPKLDQRLMRLVAAACLATPFPSASLKRGSIAAL